MRLGFAVKVLGRPGLKSHDTRRWQNAPHLSVSLAYLRDIFVYLAEAEIRMYRIASDLAPYVTHPGLPQFRGQIAECSRELSALGEVARSQGLRLSFHPSQYVVLNAEDEAVAEKSALDLAAHAQILDAMGMGAEAVVVTHVGGVYDDRQRARERFVERFERLPEGARERLVLENDESNFSPADTFWIHEHSGIRLVFDYLHFQNCNPERQSLKEAIGQALNTWPEGQTPKVHFSTPRTEFRLAERRDSEGQRREVLLRPLWTQHSDYINPFEFIRFLEDTSSARDYDVMLEAKAKDLALLRLREDIRRFAPDLAERRGLI
jgi:UV DNA damage endonuclease